MSYAKGRGQDGGETSGDPALDFLSPSFNPLKALQCSPSKVNLPHPTVQPCDNLQAYTSVIQGRRQQPAPPPSPPSSPPPSLPTTRKKKAKNVLDFMEKAHPGPFSLLQQCWRAGGRVRVTIRHCVGVRGVCEGMLVVYDKHMNLVLREVTEWYTPFRTVANGGITVHKKARRRREKRAAERDGIKEGGQETRESGQEIEERGQGAGLEKKRVLSGRVEKESGCGEGAEDKGQSEVSKNGDKGKDEQCGTTGEQGGDTGEATGNKGGATGEKGGATVEKGGATGEKGGEGRCVKQWEMCRKVEQLFVRGDSVIHVAAIKLGTAPSSDYT